MSGQIGERTARTGPHPVEDDAAPRPHPSLDPDPTATADAPGAAGVPADEQPTAAVPAVPAQARPTERIPTVRETAGTTAGSPLTERYVLRQRIGSDPAAGAEFWRAEDTVLRRPVGVTLLRRLPADDRSDDPEGTARAGEMIVRALRSGCFEHSGSARLLDVLAKTRSNSSRFTASSAAGRFAQPAGASSRSRRRWVSSAAGGAAQMLSR